MTADEVKKYINQVAFSSAEDFIEKYKEAASDDPIIGHFGLGFYSSFMVASRVEIDTLSYQEGAEPVHWSCNGSTEFELSASERSTVGTTVTLHLMEGEEEYLEFARIRQLIKTYCDFMPVPIKLDGEVVNKHEAPWKQSPAASAMRITWSSTATCTPSRKIRCYGFTSTPTTPSWSTAFSTSPS